MIVTVNNTPINIEKLLRKELKNDISVDLEGTENANELITLLIAMIDERQILEEIASASINEATKYKKFHEEQTNSITALEQKATLQVKEIKDLREQNEEYKRQLGTVANNPMTDLIAFNKELNSFEEQVGKMRDFYYGVLHTCQDLQNAAEVNVELQEKVETLSKEKEELIQQIVKSKQTNTEEVNFLQSSMDNYSDYANTLVREKIDELKEHLLESLENELDSIKKNYISHIEYFED